MTGLDPLEFVGYGAPGVGCEGPPWILGWRGAPLEAPENTLVSFRRALEAGLDGVHYDLRACAGGDPVVLGDATLERTTDGMGRVTEHGLTELFSLDAGGWFARAFVGEPLPHFDDVLDFAESPEAAPMHWIHVHDGELLPAISRRLASFERPPAVRVASRARAACREARDLGLRTALVAFEANEDDRRFVRDERIEAYAVESARGWHNAVGELEWSCERWVLGVDEPADLFAALSTGINGLTTAEPRRALATRALVRLAKGPGAVYPIEAPTLPVVPLENSAAKGDWSGNWHTHCLVRNPFPFACRVACQVVIRRGAFEVKELPGPLRLAPGETLELPLEIAGGSWSPGGDPLLAALFDWEPGPGRPAGRLFFDAPLRRVRTVFADGLSQRLEMLRESPGQARASMTARRRGRELVLSVENSGGLESPEILATLGGRTWHGSQSLRLPLPDDFDASTEGSSFNCAFEGRTGEEGARSLVLRRWAGGLPVGPGNGVPGRILPRPRG